MKKAQLEETLTSTIFYIALLLALIVIAYLLLSGKATELLGKIGDLLRFR